jgi:hypothetical protein
MLKSQEKLMLQFEPKGRKKNDVPAHKKAAERILAQFCSIQVFDCLHEGISP